MAGETKFVVRHELGTVHHEESPMYEAWRGGGIRALPHRGRFAAVDAQHASVHARPVAQRSDAPSPSLTPRSPASHPLWRQRKDDVLDASLDRALGSDGHPGVRPLHAAVDRRLPALPRGLLCPGQLPHLRRHGSPGLSLSHSHTRCGHTSRASPVPSALTRALLQGAPDPNLGVYNDWRTFSSKVRLLHARARTGHAVLLPRGRGCVSGRAERDPHAAGRGKVCRGKVCAHMPPATGRARVERTREERTKRTRREREPSRAGGVAHASGPVNAQGARAVRRQASPKGGEGAAQ